MVIHINAFAFYVLDEPINQDIMIYELVQTTLTAHKEIGIAIMGFMNVCICDESDQKKRRSLLFFFEFLRHSLCRIDADHLMSTAQIEVKYTYVRVCVCDSADEGILHTFLFVVVEAV